MALKELFSSGVVQRSELFITSKLWYLFHLILVFNLIYSADFFILFLFKFLYSEYTD